MSEIETSKTIGALYRDDEEYEPINKDEWPRCVILGTVTVGPGGINWEVYDHNGERVEIGVDGE